MDRLTPERRSWLMSRVVSKNTSPEIRVRKAAHALGLRFRVHPSALPGKPDIAFRKRKTVVFVHGCFWHRHPRCKKASLPKSRVGYWQRKFALNVRRDKQVTSELRKQGWRVATIWECETKNPALLTRRLISIFGTSGKCTRCSSENNQPRSRLFSS
jgi:DNA mismatch endonuclease (patch repair protein)